MLAKLICFSILLINAPKSKNSEISICGMIFNSCAGRSHNKAEIATFANNINQLCSNNITTIKLYLDNLTKDIIKLNLQKQLFETLFLSLDKTTPNHINIFFKNLENELKTLITYKHNSFIHLLRTIFYMHSQKKQKEKEFDKYFKIFSLIEDEIQKYEDIYCTIIVPPEPYKLIIFWNQYDILTKNNSVELIKIFKTWAKHAGKDETIHPLINSNLSLLIGKALILNIKPLIQDFNSKLKISKIYPISYSIKLFADDNEIELNIYKNDIMKYFCEHHLI